MSFGSQSQMSYGEREASIFQLKINLISCIFIRRHDAHYLDGYVHLFLIWMFLAKLEHNSLLSASCMAFFFIVIIISGVNLRIN